jgi:hypothetical protein
VVRALDRKRLGGERGMMSAQRHLRRFTIVFVAIVTTLLSGFERDVLAQAPDAGVELRQIAMSTGYESVRLPPITLAGEFPSDILNADLMTTVTAAIDWHRQTPRTRYMLDLSGAYTARARYPQLDAPGGDLTAALSRVFGSRWRLNLTASNDIASSDQMAYHNTQTGQLVANATSFDDLAATVAQVKSPSPDLSQAALFLPISQSMAGLDLYGNRILSDSAAMDAIYVHSSRISVDLHSSYSTARRISASNEPGAAIPYPSSATEAVGAAVRYDRSARTQLTATFDGSEASGSFVDKAIVTTAGYGWSGRKWFMTATAGTALRPFHIDVSGPLTTIRNQSPAIVGSGGVGYKFEAQTFVVQYRRATHDEFGHGGRDIATGFSGSVQTVESAWSWSPPRSRWLAQANFSMLRGPGNFSYIYAWLSTFDAGRQLSSSLRVTGEVLFDRHGSRGFEGFHLTRYGAHMNIVWTPQRRVVPEELR